MLRSRRNRWGHCVSAHFYGIPLIIDYGKKYKHDANSPMERAFFKNMLVTTLLALERVGFEAAILTTGHTCLEQRELVREIAGEYAGAMNVYGTDDMEWGDEIDFYQ